VPAWWVGDRGYRATDGGLWVVSGWSICTALMLGWGDLHVGPQSLKPYMSSKVVGLGEQQWTRWLHWDVKKAAWSWSLEAMSWEDLKYDENSDGLGYYASRVPSRNRTLSIKNLFNAQITFLENTISNYLYLLT
jgi:hypothetical protein